MPPTPGTPAEVRRESWRRHVALEASSEFRGLRWRPVGPAFQGGRIEALAVHPSRPDTWFVGAGAGSVWKTTNAGMTWRPVFTDQPTSSIGHIAIAPSDPDVVWIGTGEVLMARSSLAGFGVFKSVDGGSTWQSMGLEATHHISKVLIDPTNPNIVQVAAIGRNYGTNAERGVFLTTDGGRSWNKTLFVNDRTGAIDLARHPTDRQRLFAVMWEHDRRAWNHTSAGPGSGLFRSSDGGRTWQPVTRGLPIGPHLGRMGVAFAPSRPERMYLLVSNETPVPSTAAAGAPPSRRTVGGELYRSEDGGVSWRRINDGPIGTAVGYDFCIVLVSPDNPDEVYVLGNWLRRSRDGGRSWATVSGTILHLRPHGGQILHLDHHEMLIDPSNAQRMLLGNDGGLYVTADHGATWLHVNNLPIAEFYAIATDDRRPYRIYGGTQDNGALFGTAEPFASEVPGDWQHVYLDPWAGGDSYFTLPDPLDPDIVYFEHQFGDLRRKNMRTGATSVIQPKANPGDPELRYNWMTPFVISLFDPLTLYYGANRLFKSVDRGDHWAPISPDLTTNPGPEHRGNVPFGTVTSISESPLVAGLLLIGTDDGKVQYTPDEGRSWVDVSAGLPAKWVSRVVASRREQDTFYVSLTGYREDDFRTYVFRSTDRGKHWTSLANGLPSEPVNVIREDPRNPDLLYVGTDLGVYASLDRGRTWQSLGATLPTAAVHDLTVHPRADEIIIGTHGLSAFVLDARPIQQMTAQVRSSDLHLFQPRIVTLRRHPADSEPVPQDNGGTAAIHYYLRAPGAVTVRIQHVGGLGERRIDVVGGIGINEVTWDLQVAVPPSVRAEQGQRDAPPGLYRVLVEAGERRVETTLRVMDRRD